MLKKFYPLALGLLFNTTTIHAEDTIPPSPLIKPFEATYSILHKHKKVGEGQRKLQYLPNNQAQYSYHTDIKWMIFSDTREETSVVELNGNKVKPTHYDYSREGTGRDKAYEWAYDIANNSATNVKSKLEKTVNYPVNVQDKLSYHLQHRLSMIENPEQELYVYPVIGTSGSIKNYVYQYDGEEEIVLPYGLVKTVRLKREVLEKERVTYAWFAPELNYLLVKLFQVKGGVEQFEAQLKSVNYLDEVEKEQTTQ